jgi:hypothetical protein
VRGLRRRFGAESGFRPSLLESVVDESQLWLRHFVRLLQATVLFHLFQTVAALFLWFQTASPVLLVFCLDAFLGACRESLLGARLWRHPSEVGGTEGTALDSGVGVGYVSAGLIGAVLGVFHLWAGRRPDPTLAGVALAAASMLVIPIIGSYMKALAMELSATPTFRWCS